MADDEQLLELARSNPAGLRYDQACKLAEQLGWKSRGGEGSHNVYTHPNAELIRDRYPRPLNLQRGENGKAKAYQVRQMLDMARAMGIL